MHFRNKDTGNCKADNLYYGARRPPKYDNNGGGRRAKFEGPIAILGKHIFTELMPETVKLLATFQGGEK